MPRAEHSLDIRAPIDRVFAVITDPARAPEWNDNVLEVRAVSDGPVREGTTWQQTTVMLGRPTQLECRVIRYQPPCHGVLRVTGPYRAEITTRCEPVGERTRVVQIIEFEPPGGLLGKMAGGLVSPVVKRELAQSMERQRALLEREAGGGNGSGTS
jgi:uncharacterized membrane protein